MAGQFHLADLFETVAATVPDRLAVIGDHARFTYAELDARADRLAAGLAAHGVGRGDSVGLYMYNSPAFLEGFIAACKLGAVPYNVNYRYRAEELRYLFANADSATIGLLTERLGRFDVAIHRRVRVPDEPLVRAHDGRAPLCSIHGPAL